MTYINDINLFTFLNNDHYSSTEFTIYSIIVLIGTTLGFCLCIMGIENKILIRNKISTE